MHIKKNVKQQNNYLEVKLFKKKEKMSKEFLVAPNAIMESILSFF